LVVFCGDLSLVDAFNCNQLQAVFDAFRLDAQGPIMPNRTDQRDELFLTAGTLLARLKTLVFSDGDVTAESPFVHAQYQEDMSHFTALVQGYCATGAIHFTREHTVIIQRLNYLTATFDSLDSLPRDECRKNFNLGVEQLQKAIRAVPCEFDPIMVAKGSPFKAYRELRKIFANSQKRVEIFDPFLRPEVFYRYLDQVPTGVEIVVVTESKQLKGTMGQKIVSVSEPFAAERPSHYRLLETPSIHDRHIRSDDKVFHVGGSLAHAGMNDPYTITPVDSSGSLKIELDQLIATGIEWFGRPNTQTHKRP
jgi:hypothetical protein